jgi:hypothetical protein
VVVVDLVMELTATVAALRAEVDELRRQMGRDSRNSSLAPSRDSPATRAKRPTKGSGRRQGGQPGHPGSHREMVADPDRVVEHWPAACAGCGAEVTVADHASEGVSVSHQVTGRGRQRGGDRASADANTLRLRSSDTG